MILLHGGPGAAGSYLIVGPRRPDKGAAPGPLSAYTGEGEKKPVVAMRQWLKEKECHRMMLNSRAQTMRHFAPYLGIPSRGRLGNPDEGRISVRDMSTRHS